MKNDNNKVITAIIALLLVFASCLVGNCQTLNENYSIEVFDSGYDMPMQIIFDGENYFVAERSGKIYLNGNNEPIIEINVNLDGEGGLLSILYSQGNLWAYHSVSDVPNFGNIGLYKIFKDDNSSQFEENIFSEFFHSGTNHQGGTLMMDSNGWLYVGFGDSNSQWSAQRDSRYNGKIIRIDPFTGDGNPDNFLYNSDTPKSSRSRTYVKGLRNPYRTAMDSNGNIVCADVGNQSQEEISLITQTGQNLQFPFFEGFFETNINVPTNPDTGEEYVLDQVQLEPLFVSVHDENKFILANGTEIDSPYNPSSIITVGVLDDFGYPGDILFMEVFRENLMVAHLNNGEVVGITDLGELGFSGVTGITQFEGDIYLTRFNGDIVKVTYEETLGIDDVELMQDPFVVRTHYSLDGKDVGKTAYYLSDGVYIQVRDHQSGRVSTKKVVIKSGINISK